MERDFAGDEAVSKIPFLIIVFHTVRKNVSQKKDFQQLLVLYFANKLKKSQKP